MKGCDMKLKLYGAMLSPFVRKVRVMLALKNLSKWLKGGLMHNHAIPYWKCDILVSIILYLGYYQVTFFNFTLTCQKLSEIQRKRSPVIALRKCCKKVKDRWNDVIFFIRIYHKLLKVHLQHSRGLLWRFIIDKLAKIVSVTCLLHEN